MLSRHPGTAAPLGDRSIHPVQGSATAPASANLQDLRKRSRIRHARTWPSDQKVNASSSRRPSPSLGAPRAASRTGTLRTVPMAKCPRTWDRLRLGSAQRSNARESRPTCPSNAPKGRAAPDDDCKNQHRAEPSHMGRPSVTNFHTSDLPSDRIPGRDPRAVTKGFVPLATRLRAPRPKGSAARRMRRTSRFI